MQSSLNHWSQSEPCSPLIYNQPRPTVTTHRLNQLTPKPKIIIPSKQEHLTTESSSLHTTEIAKELRHHHLHHKLSISSPRRRHSLLEPLSPTPLNIIPLRPFQESSNWKLPLLCGGPTVPPLNNSGCLCPRPCKWKKSWTQRQGPKDVRAFRDLLIQPQDEAVVTQIVKDLERTFPESGSFGESGTLGGGLEEILRAYSVYDREVGYVQGLNLLAGVLLYHIGNSAQAFWALVDLMEDKELRSLYLPGFPGLKTQQAILLADIRLKLAELEEMMQILGIEPESFLDGWLLSLMGNCVPLQFMATVVEGLRQEGWLFLRQLILAYLQFLSERLLGSRDESEFLELVSVNSGRELGSQWQQVIDSVTSNRE